MANEFLIIAGITIPVAVNTASEARVYRGKAVRAMDNSLRSQVDPLGKSEWTCQTIPMAPDDVADLIDREISLQTRQIQDGAENVAE